VAGAVRLARPDADDVLDLARLITAGTFTVDALGVPMPRVTEAWTAPAAPGQRVVLTLGE
jgi:hypothetical protein